MIHESVDQNRLLLLTHIPKCAGTSFRHGVVFPNIEASLIYHPKAGWRELIRHKHDFAYLTGHFEAGIEAIIHPLNPARKRKPIRVTFLREPIDQMLSYFFYHQQLKGYADKERTKVLDVIRWYNEDPLRQNIQTRFCSNVFLNRLQSKFPKRLNFLMEFQLSAAKRNLDIYFDFVGCFETVTQDMERLCDKYGLAFVPSHAEETRTRRRLSVYDVSPSERAILEEINGRDVQLYDYARKKIWNRESL